MQYVWTDEPQPIRLLPAYQDWSRALLQQEVVEKRAKEVMTFIEQIVLQLIIGEDFGTIEEAREWLSTSIAEGKFLIDRFEQDTLELRIERSVFPDKSDQVVVQNTKTNGAGEIYTLYRVAQDLLDESDIKALEGRAEILELGKVIPIDDLLRGERTIPITQPSPPAVKRGSEATPIVAILDDGIGFLNNRFRSGPVTPWGGTRTRFHAIWLQSLDTILHPQYGSFYVYYGQILHRNEIDALLARGAALDEEAIYRELNAQVIKPGKHRSTEFSFTHGTHVLDVAAGADPSSDAVEQDWPLLAVQLPSEAVDNTAGTLLEPAIIQGVRWILSQAEAINEVSPVVINLSFGTLAGPKDGTKIIEHLLAEELKEWQQRTRRCVRLILSNGNGRLRRQVARFELEPRNPQHTTWRLQPDDNTACFAEIRTDASDDISDLMVSITTPSGAELPLATQPVNTFRQLTDGRGRPVARLYHVGARQISAQVETPAYYLIATAKTTPGLEAHAEAGAWKVEMSHQQSGKTIPLRIEVQRGETPRGYRLNGRQSYLDDPNAYQWEAETQEYSLPVLPITRDGTHSSFASATLNTETIASVGASEGPCGKPARYSGQGSAWTVPSPSGSAIAEDVPRRGVLASGTFSGSVRQLNGTSVAAGRMSHSFAMYFAQQGCVPNGQQMRDEITDIITEFGTVIAPGDTTPQQGAGTVEDQAGSRLPR